MKLILIGFCLSILCTSFALSKDVQYFSNVNTTNLLPENIVVLHLDENMNRILFDLFVDVFGNNPDKKVEVPVSLVGELYRNYTEEQLDSLKLELRNLNSSFDVIRNRVELLEERFIVAKIQYEVNHDLSQFEKKFIEIGEEMIILQKVVLKFTNNNNTISEPNRTYFSGRHSPFFNIFDRLAGLLLGVNTGLSYQQNTEPLSSNKINQVIKLMKALQSIKNVPTNSKLKPNSDLVKLQNMLSRLQQIQEFNRMANERQPFQKSETINPYRYEAVLNLVRLVGAASGANQLRTLWRLFGSSNTKNNVKNTDNSSEEKLKKLMKAIEAQESQKQKEFEAQRHRELLNELIRNQNKQQEQLNNIIKMIQLQNNKGSTANSDNQSNNAKDNTPISSSTPSSSSNQRELVNKLREQRQQLNNLLKALGQTNGPTNNQMGGGAGQSPNSQQTQETFTNLLKNIGPMMGALAQSGLISPKQIQSSQKSLSGLLKAANNKGFQMDSTKPIIQRFLEELKSILDSI